MDLLTLIAAALTTLAPPPDDAARPGVPARPPFWSLQTPPDPAPAPLDGTFYASLTVVDEGGFGVPADIDIHDHATLDVTAPDGSAVAGALDWDAALSLLTWQAAAPLAPDTDYTVDIVVTELSPDGFEGDLVAGLVWSTAADGSTPAVGFPGVPTAVFQTADCEGTCCLPELHVRDRGDALDDIAALLSLRFIDAGGALTDARVYHPRAFATHAHVWPAEQARYCYQLTAMSLLNDSTRMVEHCFPHDDDLDLGTKGWCQPATSTTVGQVGDADGGCAGGTSHAPLAAVSLLLFLRPLVRRRRASGRHRSIPT